MPLPVRILIAGLVGGILVFFTGFVEHEILGWGSRTFSAVKNDDEFRKEIKGHRLEPAIYAFPSMPNEKTGPEMESFIKKWEEGPSGFLIVAGDMNMGKMIGLEFLSNVIASLIAAWIVSLIAADKTFLWRWKAVVLMGIFGWVSIVATWDRFVGDLPEGDFDFTLSSLRLDLAFSGTTNLSLLTQYDSTENSLGGNLRFRWTPRPGTDLFLVWARNYVAPPGESLRDLRLRLDGLTLKLRWTLRR